MVKRTGGALLLSLEVDPASSRPVSSQLCAALRDIILAPVERFCIAPVPVNALVLGFSGVAPADIVAGVRVLAEVLERNPARRHGRDRPARR